MQKNILWGVIGVCVLMLGIVAWTQAEQSAAAPQPIQPLALQQLSAQLDQMVRELEQGNVAPERLAALTTQIKDVSQTLKQLAGVPDQANAPVRSCCQVGAAQPQKDAQ